MGVAGGQPPSSANMKTRLQCSKHACGPFSPWAIHPLPREQSWRLSSLGVTAREGAKQRKAPIVATAMRRTPTLGIPRRVHLRARAHGHCCASASPELGPAAGIVAGGVAAPRGPAWGEGGPWVATVATDRGLRAGGRARAGTRHGKRRARGRHKGSRWQG